MVEMLEEDLEVCAPHPKLIGKMYHIQPIHCVPFCICTICSVQGRKSVGMPIKETPVDLIQIVLGAEDDRAIV